jgi:Holliday junction resolvase RusA-like endonuclease
MKPIQFKIDGPVRGKGRPRFGNGRTFTDKKTMTAEAIIATACQSVMTDRKPLTGALLLSLRIFKAVPKSWSKKKRAEALGGDLLPTSRPDLDNIVKLVADALNGIAYADDAQITELDVKRMYADTESMSVLILERKAND